jgi:hypothetical protein
MNGRVKVLGPGRRALPAQPPDPGIVGHAQRLFWACAAR